jgi:hypothetical protein
MTSFLVNSVSLSLVLGNVGVNKRHDIRTDWCFEHGWEDSSGSSLASGRVNGNLVKGRGDGVSFQGEIAKEHAVGACSSKLNTQALRRSCRRRLAGKADDVARVV